MEGVLQQQRYLKTTETSEHWAKNAFKFIMYVVVPLFVLPSAGISLLKYYKSGGSKDALNLVYPAS